MFINLLVQYARTKETTVRAVRRSKRSGSKIYVLIGSSEFLLHVLPFFQANTSNNAPSKYVLVAADSWFGNFSKGKSNQSILKSSYTLIVGCTFTISKLFKKKSGILLRKL